MKRIKEIKTIKLIPDQISKEKLDEFRKLWNEEMSKSAVDVRPLSMIYSQLK